MQRIIFILALVPLPALAESYSCPTAGYCTNALECAPDTAVMSLEIAKSGVATFGWVDTGARFTATAIQLAGMRVFYAQNDGTSIQTLVLAETGQATFSVSAFTDGLGLYTSIQSLTCEKV